MKTYPEDTDRVVRAVRRPIRLDHAEHAVELPVDEEHDEQVMSVPEPFKAGTAAFLHRVPHHDAQCGGHDPPSDTGASREVGSQESDNALASVLRISVSHSKLGKVDHVCGDVNEGAEDDGPGGSLVESDVLVERNVVVQWGTT